MNTKTSSSSSVVAPPAGLKQLKQEQQLADDDQQGIAGVKSCLELRLGISSSSDNNNGGNSSSPWRVDPWSLLAATQDVEKKAHQQRPDDCVLQRENRAAAPQQPVGWPPVRAFRKNLQPGSKPADGGGVFSSKLVKPPGSSSEDVHGAAGGERPPMLVKVNLEGCPVGRKVDLHAHRGYGSLSRALQSMFRGFLLSVSGQWRMAANKDDEDDEEKQQQPETSRTYILLYEDSEGDRMLVGDVPWELFVSSVKRLYIARAAGH